MMYDGGADGRSSNVQYYTIVICAGIRSRGDGWHDPSLPDPLPDLLTESAIEQPFSALP